MNRFFPFLMIFLLSSSGLWSQSVKKLARGEFDKVYTGFLSGQIKFAAELHFDDGKIEGTYAFIHERLDRRLIGEIDKKGSITLKEINEEDMKISQFEGIMKNTELCRGTWSPVGETESVDFVLLESEDAYQEIIKNANTNNGTNLVFNYLNRTKKEVDPQSGKSKITTVEWDKLSHNFHSIEKNSKVRHTYYFTNTGPFPAFINNVKPSCGCTTPEWSKDAIPPGGRGSVTIEFNSSGKKGYQSKRVTVVMNTRSQNFVLTFIGNVQE